MINFIECYNSYNMCVLVGSDDNESDVSIVIGWQWKWCKYVIVYIIPSVFFVSMVIPTIFTTLIFLSPEPYNFCLEDYPHD